MVIKINNIRDFYKTLNSNTKHTIKTTLIGTISLIFIAVAAYTSGQYEFVKICDDILEAAKSVMVIGFIGALFFEYIDKRK